MTRVSVFLEAAKVAACQLKDPVYRPLGFMGPHEAEEGGMTMSTSEQELREALSEITRVAGRASQSLYQDTQWHDHSHEENRARHPQKLSKKASTERCLRKWPRRHAPS